MTPVEEARLIQLWQASTPTATIAQQLGIPRGTMASRAYALRQQGKIQPRPKGGAYPRQKAQARQEDPPATPRCDLRCGAGNSGHAAPDEGLTSPGNLPNGRCGSRRP
jgi:hypothetical protein